MRPGFRSVQRMAPVVLFAIAAAGCSTVSEWVSDNSSNATPPTELSAIDTARDVSVLWDRDVGSGSGKRYLKLRPSFDDERVYVAESNGDVSAYNLESGDLEWDTDTDERISGGPGSGDGLVLVGTLDGDIWSTLENGAGGRPRSDPHVVCS